MKDNWIRACAADDIDAEDLLRFAFTALLHSGFKQDLEPEDDR